MSGVTLLQVLPRPLLFIPIPQNVLNKKNGILRRNFEPLSFFTRGLPLLRLAKERNSHFLHSAPLLAALLQMKNSQNSSSHIYYYRGRPTGQSLEFVSRLRGKRKMFPPATFVLVAFSGIAFVYSRDSSLIFCSFLLTFR